MAAHHLRIGRTFEEKRYRDLKNMRNLLQAAGADAIGALLVLLNLLKCQTERVPKFFLAHSQHHPAHADPAPDMLVGRVWRLFCQSSHGAPPLFSSMPRDSKSVTIETVLLSSWHLPAAFFVNKPILMK